jgi:hypothetical protein
MTTIKKSPRKPYFQPKLIKMGRIIELTKARMQGPKFDGGSFSSGGLS